MKSFISKLQKDLQGLQDAIKKDSDELLKKVKTYATKENFVSAGMEVEKLVEQRLKKLEPTINKVVGEIRKNAAKAGINVDELEAKVRSNVTKAAHQLKEVADKRGLTQAAQNAAQKAAQKAKVVSDRVSEKVGSKINSKGTGKTAAKKSSKTKSPTSKAAIRKKKPSATQTIVENSSVESVAQSETV